jgi:hypothetical protein
MKFLFCIKAIFASKISQVGSTGLPPILAKSSTSCFDRDKDALTYVFLGEEQLTSTYDKISSFFPNEI